MLRRKVSRRFLNAMGDRPGLAFASLRATRYEQSLSSSLPVLRRRVTCFISLSAVDPCSISLSAAALSIPPRVFRLLVVTGRGVFSLTFGIQRLHGHNLIRAHLPFPFNPSHISPSPP